MCSFSSVLLYDHKRLKGQGIGMWLNANQLGSARVGSNPTVCARYLAQKVLARYLGVILGFE